MPPILETIDRNANINRRFPRVAQKIKVVPMSAVEILVDEHRLISRMVKALTVLHKRLESGQDTDVTVLTKIVDFFQIFVDKNHHVKEEEGLFPALGRHGLNPQECTIESLEREHEQARNLMATLTRAIEKYEAGDPAARGEDSTALRNSIDLYNDHIWKENVILFPMSEDVLQPSEHNDITKQYVEVEKKLDVDLRSKYEKLVSVLEEATDVGRGENRPE